MFHRILIPLDLSERPSRAVEVAAQLADPACRITLLHVVAEIEGVPADELGEFYAGLGGRARQVLERHAKKLAEGGLASRVEIKVGRRGPEIVRLAEQDDTDLIVVGSHAIDPAQPGGGIGTLSHQIALLAPCDVLLVR